MPCPKCGGTLYGDGYTSVVHCEFADEAKYQYEAPDAGPFYCDFEGEPLKVSDEPWRHEEWAKRRVCSKCGVTVAENRRKYCGDGSDKDNEHRWVDVKA
jgi:hypothetical protein